MEKRRYSHEYGKAASTVMCLCKAAGIFGSDQVVVADFWFANLALVQGLKSNGLHLLGMIKQGDSGFPKKGLCKELDKRERGACAVATTVIDEEKFMAVAWQGKSDCLNKSKGKKKILYQPFWPPIAQQPSLESHKRRSNTISTVCAWNQGRFHSQSWLKNTIQACQQLILLTGMPNFW